MPPTSDTQPTISRREAVRRAALLVGVAISPSWLASVDRVRAAAQASYLTPAQLALTRAVADRIIPRTDTPGASDVGVPEFIDRLYGEFMSDAERQLLTAGLNALARAAAADVTAQPVDATPFVSLSGDQQDSLLRTIARVEEGQPQGPFRLIRTAVILGYFTSEEVGRTVLHYEPVPGRYDSCIPLDEVGTRSWTT
jgi:hypothetical protein